LIFLEKYGIINVCLLISYTLFRNFEIATIVNKY
jgi:hypothetical protein